MKQPTLPVARVYIVTLLAFLVLDGLWLGLVARGFYRQHLGHLMAARMSPLPAVVFYLLFVGAVLVFVVVPGLRAPSLGPTLLRAAFFGLITYGTYDLTNQATLRDWPVIVTVVDMLWGTFVTVAASAVGVLAGLEMRAPRSAGRILHRCRACVGQGRGPSRAQPGPGTDGARGH